MSKAYALSDIRLPTAEEVELAAQSSRKLAVALGHGDDARLRLVDGDIDITVPVSAIHMLADILAEMAAGKAISLVPVDAELTTQQAADLLNVSRPYVVKLIDTGQLAGMKVGRHRRVRFEDVMSYKQDRRDAARRALAELTAEAQALDLGY